MNGIMAVSEQRLDEFIEIYERVEGQHIEREEARKIADNLVTLYLLFMQLRQTEQVQIADEAP